MMTVLVIEDNPEIRENISELLELEGYNVITAQNGKTGLQLVEAHLPHLILCDIMMPETNGHDVIKAIKQNQKTANIPFIFLTALSEKKEVESGLKLGACAYIQKPFAVEEFLQCVQRELGKQSP